MEGKKSIQIKHVSIFRLFWFVKLNMNIHKEDPIFKKVHKTTWSKFLFILDFSLKLARQHRFILLENNQVLGALALEERKKSIFVYAIGVLEGFKRKGYGTLLMKFTEEFALKKNREFVNFSVLLDNTSAISFYEKLNYRSQGVSLTLLRIFLWKLTTLYSNIKFQDKITLKKLTNKREIKNKTFYWWYEEIAAFAGSEVKEFSKEDAILELDFKQKWLSYEIFTNDLSTGVVIIVQAKFISTIVLFSDPNKTWTRDWILNLICTLYDEKCSKSKHDSEQKPFLGQQYKLEKSSLLQVFLTHHHLENLQNKLAIDCTTHDSFEDRQIYYKKIVL